MRIVVNDIAASKGGALSVLKDFYSCVRENDKENEWIFLLGDSYLEETDNIKVITLPEIKKSGIKKLFFDFFTGRKYINSLNPDAVISLQNIVTFGVKAPQTVYIHQAIPFQSQKRFSFFKGNERKLAVYQYIIGAIIKRSAKRADKVIVQTNWMKKAVSAKSGASEEKIYVVTPALRETLNFDASEYKNNIFFYPTSNAVYKNNVCITKACDLLNQSGINDFEVVLTVNDSKHKNISAIGFIRREEVLRYYTASTLIFPSYIESFAYPLAEARALGSIVLAADCDFSREVLSGYENAYFFDPFSPEQLSELMCRVIDGDIKRKDAVISVNGGDNWIKVLDIIKEQL